MQELAGARELRGIGVGRGWAVGPAVRFHEPALPPPNAPVLRDGRPVAPEDVPAFITSAFAHVARDLHERALRVTGTLHDVLAATAQIALDPALQAGVRRELAEGRLPVAAVHEAVGSFVTAFTAAGGVLAERVGDLEAVRDRVIASLVGAPPPGVPVLHEPSIILARDLAPAEVAALDLTFVRGIVLEAGGPTGHTAIVASQLGLPCMVRTDGAGDVPDGARVLVDARAGLLVLDPSEAAVARLAERERTEAQLMAHAPTSAAGPGLTADGHQVALLANVGTLPGVQAAARARGPSTVAGLGLVRTEVLFLEATVTPTVAEQEEDYAALLAAFGTKRVVIRTLDAGADKPVPFASQPGEENPALGVRGYRLRRVMPGLLTDQLSAIARAAHRTGTTPWVMAPMVATAAEAREFAASARAVGIGSVGVMIEIPAAALRARDILAEVDFVSIGTNDLTQYALAADRLEGALSDLLDPWQPAVLDLVALTTRAGTQLGKPVGVCGEAAADPLMALVLVGLGVSSLSMSLSSVPLVRHALGKHALARCEEMAAAALAARSPEQARGAVVELLAPEVRALLV